MNFIDCFKVFYVVGEKYFYNKLFFEFLEFICSSIRMKILLNK